jgi:hypothetical protein
LQRLIGKRFGLATLFLGSDHQVVPKNLAEYLPPAWDLFLSRVGDWIILRCLRS